MPPTERDLDGLDHFIKRELKIQGYLRYMDDILLFHDDSNKLKETRERLKDWLWAQRGQQFKPSTGKILHRRDPMRYLGYHLSIHGINPGKKLRRQLRNRLRQTLSQGTAGKMVSSDGGG